MPIPRTRTELVKQITTTYEQLQVELERVGPREARLPCVDDWTVKDLLAVRAWWDEGFVKVEIHDTGQGLPPEQLEEIWEPDFTTKSRGTGLGLPMVRQIITGHQGRVEGRNNPEGGAVFLVELPA